MSDTTVSERSRLDIGQLLRGGLSKEVSAYLRPIKKGSIGKPRSKPQDHEKFVKILTIDHLVNPAL